MIVTNYTLSPGTRTSVTWADVVAETQRNGRIAQVCASLGWRVLPLRPDTKRPALRQWPSLATTDLDTLADWWTCDYQSCLVGVLTGPESGIWVLDIDVKTVNGFATARDLFGAHGTTHAPQTFRVRTPSGGQHWYFAHPTDGRVIGNSAERRLGPGLDSRGRHGQVVAPGTITPHGEYEVIDGTVPQPAPRWLEDLVERRRREATDAPLAASSGIVEELLQSVADRLSLAGVGGRNQALNEAAFRLGTLGVDRETAWRWLATACEQNGLLHDDGPEQCWATFDSGWAAGRTTGE